MPAQTQTVSAHPLRADLTHSNTTVVIIQAGMPEVQWSGASRYTDVCGAYGLLTLEEGVSPTLPQREGPLFFAWPAFSSQPHRWGGWELAQNLLSAWWTSVPSVAEGAELFGRCIASYLITGRLAKPGVSPGVSATSADPSAQQPVETVDDRTAAANRDELLAELRLYEQAYGLSSEEFYRRWQSFDFEDCFDANRWAILYRQAKELRLV